MENRRDWVREVSYAQDQSQVRTGQAPRVMTPCRSLAISVLRIAGWDTIGYHAADRAQAFALA